MKFIGQALVMFLVAVLSAQAVPPVLNYAGQVAVNGQPFEGEGLFKFALVNTDGKITYWSNDGTSLNGSEPQASIKVSVSGGLYSLLLGNTAMAGMGAINPQVFSQHSDARLRVWFSDGVNGFQQLSPDRPFASVPYAFSAGKATIADGSINKAMLGSDVIADLNKTVTITRDMLPQDVRDDLNKTVTITRSMLPADVLSDLNRTISKPMLGSDVIADLNATIGMDRLSAEVINKLDQNGSGGSGIAVGSIISFPSGQAAPTGYSLYQRGEPKELVWEEKAPVSVARWAYDGVEVLDGKIYFVGGGTANNSAHNITERYDPVTNTWETLSPMSVARMGVACSVLNGKLYAIGGLGLASVEVYDPSTESWSAGVALPSQVNHGTAITVGGKIYLIGGNSSGQVINQVLCFDPSTTQWSAKANMPTARDGLKLVWFENRIWAIGGKDGSYYNKVESYDPSSNTWKTNASTIVSRFLPSAWIGNGNIYVGGGYNDIFQNSIEVYNPIAGVWSLHGNLPEKKEGGDAVVFNDHVYVVAGKRSSGNTSGVYSNKVYAADLNASVDGVLDLYRKDGNASAGTPIVQAEVLDGSVTIAKLDSTILKYLKPEITAQPQAQNVYADTNVSFSVTAEGKYLTYQWKKDGADLTGETNATLNITDANASLHDGNYSVLVSNDFGSVESGVVELVISFWSPLSVSGLTLWLDANDTNSIIHQSNKISVWNDKSGNSNNATQSLSDKQPNFANGQVSFDGLNDILELPSMGLSGDAMVIFSYTPLNDSGYSVIGSSSNNDHWDRYNINGHTYANHFTQTRMTGVGLNFPKTGEQIVAYMADSSSSNYKIRLNGTTVREFSQSFAFADNVKQIGGALATGSEFNGKLDELIITDEFSLVVIEQIEGYLADKWGLTNNLPSDHPYKNTAP